MIYTAQQLNSHLTHLVLGGINADYELEWIGTVEQRERAEVDSLTDDEKLEAERTTESDRYDLANCHTR